MAKTQHSVGTAQELKVERELTIDLRPYGWQLWELLGTRAQLEAEGVIPAATEWPATGARMVEWTTGRLRFALHRTRPEGLKGPVRLWANGDWWSLRCEPVNAPAIGQQRLIDMQRALDRAVYQQSPAGQREWSEQGRRGEAARRDKAFQTFSP